MPSLQVSCLEVQTGLAGGFGERLHAPVVEVSVAVEHHLGDVLRLALLGHERADLLGGVGLVAFAETAAQILRQRRGAGKRLARRCRR